jgi:hypothetical protein
MTLWALLLLLLAPPGTTPPVEPSTVGGALEAAALALSAKRWDEVEVHALTASRLDPGNPDAVELIVRARARGPSTPASTPPRRRLEPWLAGAVGEMRGLWQRRLKEAARAGRHESVQHGRIREMMLPVAEESPP